MFTVAPRIAARSVYLDTCAVNHLLNDNQGTDVVRRRTQAGEIVLPISLVTVAELAGTTWTDADKALRLMQWVFAHSNGPLLLPTEQILNAEVRSYVDGGSPVFYLPESIREEARVLLTSSPAEELKDRLADFVSSVRQRKKQAWPLQDLQKLREHVQRTGGLTLVGVVDLLERPLIMDLVTKLGSFDRCYQKGLRPLAQFPSVRMLVQFAALLILEDASGRRRLEPQDGWDLQHAVCATTSDIFVTDDLPLLDRVRQLGLSSPLAFSLSEFLESLRDADQGGAPGSIG